MGFEDLRASTERRRLDSKMKLRQSAKDEAPRIVVGGKSKPALERDITKAQLLKLNYQESRKVKPLSAFMEDENDNR